MAQAYHRMPSEIYGVAGATGFFFDRGIFLFGRYVEGEMSAAEERASNAMFARSNRERAFAACMGDDMGVSSAGFADPFTTGAIDTQYSPDVGARKLKRRSKSRDNEEADELLWSESIA